MPGCILHTVYNANPACQPGAGPPSDPGSARRADRIVREAEAEAKALLAEAEAAARSDPSLRREELARRAGETLSGRIGEIDNDIRVVVKEGEAEADRWVRRRRGEIERIVDRLIAMVLPP